MAKRIEDEGMALPSASSIVVDLADDPPLGASLEAVALEETARLVFGAGALLLATGARRAVFAVASRAAERALVMAIALHAHPSAGLEVVRLPAWWPTAGLAHDLGRADAFTLAGEELLDIEAAALGRRRAPHRLTIAGAVRRPTILRWESASPTAAEAVLAADGALAADWIALDGGIAGRPRLAEEQPRSSLLLVLPRRHGLVRRAQVSRAEWLRRAGSACQGCRACSERCPAFLLGTGLEPHRAIALALTGRPAPSAIRFCLSAACGVCDLACPAELSPRTLVEAAPPPAATSSSLAVIRPHPDRTSRRMTRREALERAGLSSFAAPKPPSLPFHPRSSGSGS